MKRANTAVIGIERGPEKITGRFVQTGGSELLPWVQHEWERGVFKTLIDMFEYLLKYHWVCLAECDFSNVPIFMRTANFLDAVEGVPVYIGELIKHRNVGTVDFLTTRNQASKIANRLILYSPEDMTFREYERTGDDWKILRHVVVAEREIAE